MQSHDPEHFVEHGTFGTNRFSQGVRPVKSLISSIALAVLAVSSFAPLANAQDGGVVVVLDVAKVFKVNQAFDSEMKNIKTSAEQLKSQIQQQQETIKAEAMQISQYEAGTPERNQMEAKVEQKQAALRTTARQKEADLLNREARVYYDTYMKMKEVVSSIAAKHNISLVVRFDGSEIDPSSRPEVIKAVNRSVVYHRQIDITSMVIEAMGPRVAESSTNLK